MANPLSTLTQDLRFALRQMRRTPGFTAVAVLTLALGIGATSAVFTLFYQVILRSLPVSHPEQLYKVGKQLECCVDSGGQGDWRIFSYDLYKSFRDNTASTAGIAAVQAGANLVSAHRAGDAGGTVPLTIRFVSGNYFSVLGVGTYAGRLLRPEDDREAAPPAAVISYPMWQTKFHGDPTLVGSTVIFSGHPFTIAGITAANFLGERNEADSAGVWVPLAQEPTLEPERSLLRYPGAHWLDLLVRVTDHARVAQVQGSIQQQLVGWLRTHKNDTRDIAPSEITRQTTELAPASSGINALRDQYEKSLKLLLFSAGFVLLIACANLANLLLVRGMARQQELSVRMAMGAPRQRLIRQMLVESLTLSCIGGLASLLVAYAGSRAILSLALPNAQISPLQASPSLPVLGFSFALAVVTGVLFGIAPAWIASRSNPVEALRGANRSTRDPGSFSQKFLVVLQAALSLALLSSAGLLIQSLRAIEHQNFRFETEGRMIAFFDLQAAGYSAEKLPSLYQQIDQSFSGLPSIKSFAYATYGPMANNNWNGGVAFPGGDPNARNIASYAATSTQFFDAVGTRLLLGRRFDLHDTATSTHVAVINRTFAQKFLKGKNPLGEHFGPDGNMTNEYEIVGVVDDSKYGDPNEEANPMYFTPIEQSSDFSTIHATEDVKQQARMNERFKHFAGNLIVHYRGDKTAVANQIREKLKAINPDIPVIKLTTYDEQVGTYFTQQELVVRLTSIFGALALTLAAIGLYGVTAYSVQRRTSEIGIRMAVGASRGSVLLNILRAALTQAGIGLLLGLPMAYAAARLLRSQLYQTSTFQPLILLGSALLLLLAAVLAALIPARRAASIDPMQALRSE